MPAVAIDSSLYDWWMVVWLWLLRDNASRTTVLLMVTTGIYAYLTWKMAKAIAHQTRAMIQPIVSIEFFIEKEESFPKGRFEVKNLGAQPLLILDMRLECRRRKNVDVRGVQGLRETHPSAARCHSILVRLYRAL